VVVPLSAFCVHVDDEGLKTVIYQHQQVAEQRAENPIATPQDGTAADLQEQC
jgi:hypothetical protein